jgi:hypothetical protein
MKEENYKLLVFNQDYADEHNVPALECMSEEEYQKWLVTPSGELNPSYEETKALQEEYEKEWADFWQHLKDKGYTYQGEGNTSKIPKEDIETLAYEKRVRALSRVRDNFRVHSNMYAYLGNSGECFEEDYSNLYLMEDFVDDGLVKVTDVDKSFYDIFHRAKLNKLSLCNVFTIGEE